MSRLSQCVVTEEWKEEDDDEVAKTYLGEEEEKGDPDEYVIKGGSPENMNQSSRYPLFKAALQKAPPQKGMGRPRHPTRDRNNSTGTVLVKNAIQDPNISNLIDW